MHFTQTERGLAALATAYFAYRLWTGVKDGIVYGDGDDDVQADKHPTAFILTMLSLVLLLGLAGYIAIGADVGFYSLAASLHQP